MDDAEMIVRLWVNDVEAGEWKTTASGFDDLLRTLSEDIRKQAHMLEIEFPGAPEGERYLRFGTSKARMVDPIEVDEWMSRQGKKP